MASEPPAQTAGRWSHKAAVSLRRRILLLAAIWIAGLLLVGGLALDRIVTDTIIRNFDEQLSDPIPAMLAAAEVDAFGEVRFNRAPVAPPFNEPYSGFYWQVTARNRAPFRSRSLWDRELPVDFSKSCVEPCVSRSAVFRNEPLRLVERDGIIPGSSAIWRFQVAESTTQLDQQLREVRRTLILSLGALGAGLMLLAFVQASIGLMPLARLSLVLSAIRSGRESRVPTDNVPPEVAPLVQELNALLESNEKTAEESRTHAGNLAHALKTPMSVLTNAAAAEDRDLAATVVRELSTMRRHVDHHLARARAMGRRTSATARAEVWPVLERLITAIERIYVDRKTLIDLAGDRSLVFRGERQDLEEMAGNLIDNAAKYGGGRVFVTVSAVPGDMLRIQVEDDGHGIPIKLRESMFERGSRLDTGKPGTGLGLAIVRDVAGIYGGTVELTTSEDLGGLMVILTLPARIETPVKKRGGIRNPTPPA